MRALPQNDDEVSVHPLQPRFRAIEGGVSSLRPAGQPEYHHPAASRCQDWVSLENCYPAAFIRRLQPSALCPPTDHLLRHQHISASLSPIGVDAQHAIASSLSEPGCHALFASPTPPGCKARPFDGGNDDTTSVVATDPSSTSGPDWKHGSFLGVECSAEFKSVTPTAFDLASISFPAPHSNATTVTPPCSTKNDAATLRCIRILSPDPHSTLSGLRVSVSTIGASPMVLHATPGMPDDLASLQPAVDVDLHAAGAERTFISPSLEVGGSSIARGQSAPWTLERPTSDINDGAVQWLSAHPAGSTPIPALNGSELDSIGVHGDDFPWHRWTLTATPVPGRPASVSALSMEFEMSTNANVHMHADASLGADDTYDRLRCSPEH